MPSLTQLITEELAVPVQAGVSEFAAHIAAQFNGAARAVLFYGSCLRTEQLQGEMIDFYLIVSDYKTAYGKSWLATWNRRLPPNVFPFQHNGLIAKVAVLSESDFHDLNRPAASAVSVWARFAQPSRLVWCADETARHAAVIAISGAAPTLLNAALACVEREVDVLDLWQSGFQMTYGAELRAVAALYHTSIASELRGDKILLLPDVDGRIAQEKNRWPGLRRRGKLLTIARLAKAAFTYAGGIDYLAWKINRHAGTHIIIRPWQRKWPLVAALFLVPKLLAKGAVR